MQPSVALLRGSAIPQEHTQHACVSRFRPQCGRPAQKRAGLTCSATATSSGRQATAPQYTPVQQLQVNMVNALFGFEPLFKFATKQAREMMVKRGAAIGVSWADELNRLKDVDWESKMLEIKDPSLVTPAYYLAPFHAYPEGNMSWQAALEVEVAAKCVHAPIFDPQAKELDPLGDARMRARYHELAQPLLRGRAASPRDIVDIGCATGMSSTALLNAYPEATVTGVDLSPFFLSVGSYLQDVRRAEAAAAGAPVQTAPVRFLHAAGEATGLPDASQDVVSVCLVCHELPQKATRDIIAEAARILRPGGALCIMEMDPASPFFARLATNAFAFTAFKSTEPYLDEYVTLNIESAIEAAGFEYPRQENNTPRHRTIVAHKL